jgi:DNA-binding MarR family transcriptional regulator
VITPLGKERYTAAHQAIRDVQADLTAEMSEADRTHFRRILSSFRDE